MNLSDVLSLVHSLVRGAGVDDWDLAFDRARRWTGQTGYVQRRTTLSRHLMSLHDETQVRGTILYEITHARINPHHRHDAVWTAEAARPGATGRRSIDAQAPRLRGRWVGRCPAGHKVDHMRRPASPVSYSRYAPRFSLDHLLAWNPDDEPVPRERISECYSHFPRPAHI